MLAPLSAQPGPLSHLGASAAHPLVIYLSNSIKRDVRLLAAMGAIADSGAKVICSYLPHATDDDDADDSAVLRALASSGRDASATAETVGTKRLSRQRSETAPLRPAPLAHGAIPLQTQRAPGSPRKEKARHEGLGARLGAFFNKLSLDSEPSSRGSKGSITASPRSPAFPLHERSLSDAPAHCMALSSHSDGQRKVSHGSSGSSAAASTTVADDSGDSASSRSSVSQAANRKRSFTHLGLSMESLPSAAPGRGPQLRRTKPAARITGPRLAGVGDGQRLAKPSNSLGLVLQASAAQPNHSRPIPAPIRTQRHHASFGTKEPRSPTRLHCLSAIVGSRATSPKPAMAFPPMPSEACQAAMLSESAELPSSQRALSDSELDSSQASLIVVATAAYDYASGVKGDLEFSKGERIVIQSKVNDDWWFGSILPAAGRNSTGRSGMFPCSHVSVT
ncbi:hypothetical protein IWW36_000997 [Coemansia brasiliensis]|uniref:SH3 domain-containing protein n=1 Tax=Coemansia brasiliensis TaxID=2650707 RepID=A0A9W8IIH8_9FUNG|nr:hypothetical protein IWW36_000997 [Coemansia brasiliensis]